MKKSLLILAILILTGCNRVYPNDYDIPYNDPETELTHTFEVNKQVLEENFFARPIEDEHPEKKCLDETDPEEFYLFKIGGIGSIFVGDIYRKAYVCEDKYFIYDFINARGPMYFGPFDLETHEFIDLTPEPGVVEEERTYYSKSSQKELPYYFVEPEHEVNAILIYMHGAGGGYEQGISDDIFEGNFAQLKSYTKENGVLYITPETSEFGEVGGAELLDLVNQLRIRYGDIPIFLSGASAGGRTIFHAFEQLDERAVKVDGFIFICPAVSEKQVEELDILQKDLPIWIEAGEIDTIVPVERMNAFNDKLLELGFEPELNIIPGGGHDTPVNEIEWEMVLEQFRMSNK